MDTPDPAEIELKLRLDPAAVTKLKRHPALAALQRGDARRSRVVSTYLDTPDFRLADAGVALRLRRDGRQWLQTVKGPANPDSGGGLASRPEYEWSLPGPRIDPLRLATTPWRALFAKAKRKGGLEPRFTTDFVRTTIPLVFPDSTMAHACIDVGAIRTGDSAAAEKTSLCELELELEAGDSARLFELARALAADLPLAVEPASKAARGIALVLGERAAPVSAEPIDLSRSATAAEAFAAIARNCLRQIEGNAAGLIADDDPEWVHQMRVGARRLRACLALARDFVPVHALEPLQAELRWLADALGPVRDLDVFAKQTLPTLSGATNGLPADRVVQSALRALARRVNVRRTAARTTARAAVASPRFQQLLLAVAAWCATPDLGTAAGSDEREMLAGRARDLGKRLLRGRHRKLAELGGQVADGTPEERHAARIAAKKLRYATEFFATLFPRKRTNAYRKALTALQDVLGELNDAAVAARFAAEIAGTESKAASVLHGWAVARGAARHDDLALAWQAFADAEPFWTRG